MAAPSTRKTQGQSVHPVAILVNSERCVRVRNRFSECDACVRACGAGAISLKPTLSLNKDACTGCGACLHACPAGVFDGDDAYTSLMETAAPVAGKGTIELACPRHAKPEHGPAACAAVVRTSVCLAAFGPAAYVNLLAVGMDAVVARLDACPDCPLGAAQASIVRSIETARQIVAAWQQEKRIVDWGALPADGSGRLDGGEWRTRPLVAPGSGRLSRRDFLRVATARPGETDVARSNDDTAGLPLALAKKVPRERRRLLIALKAANPPAEAAMQALPQAIFPRITADESCIACSVCARLCPTGALASAVNFDDVFTLSFHSAICTNCGECLTMCDWDSLHVQGGAPLGEVLSMQTTTLLTGPVQRCYRCNSRFASVDGATLCPVCTFRARQPFGSATPPGLQRRMARRRT